MSLCGLKGGKSKASSVDRATINGGGRWGQTGNRCARHWDLGVVAYADAAAVKDGSPHLGLQGSETVLCLLS